MSTTADYRENSIESIEVEGHTSTHDERETSLRAAQEVPHGDELRLKEAIVLIEDKSVALIESVREAGRILHSIKQRFPRGKFRKWIEKCNLISFSTAKRYVSIFEFLKDKSTDEIRTHYSDESINAILRRIQAAHAPHEEQSSPIPTDESNRLIVPLEKFHSRTLKTISVITGDFERDGRSLSAYEVRAKDLLNLLAALSTRITESIKTPNPQSPSEILHELLETYSTASVSPVRAEAIQQAEEPSEFPRTRFHAASNSHRRLANERTNRSYR